MPPVLLFVISIVCLSVVAKHLFRPLPIEAPARKLRKICRFSVLMLLVPASVVFLFASVFVLFRFGVDHPVVPFFRQFLPLEGKLWFVSGVIGLLSAIRASHLAKWTGDGLQLVALHVASLAFLWFTTYLPYLGHPD